MNISFFPSVLKEKLTQSVRWINGGFFLILSILLFLAIFTFNIDDNSFLTQTNNPTSNAVGSIGSHAASFLIYSFGLLSYLMVFFLLINSFAIFKRKNYGFFFIRLLLVLISLVLIPQLFLYWDWGFNYITSISSWGEISFGFYNIHQSEWVSYVTTLIGIILFLSVLNIFSFFKLLKLTVNPFKQPKTANINDVKIKKEPIINSSPNINQKIVQPTKQNSKDLPISDSLNDTNYSPSLNILDNQSNDSHKRKSQFNIEERSELLEKVFADFNIQIKVINVKLGPVVTLYEILPAAGIKINSIINLADDISRSMGVGPVRISQIFGTQYLGVEVPNDKRESVTIKELLSNDNFKNTLHKIPICIGKDISGNIEVIDLSKTPHLLVAGTTGSGKSVFINTLLASLLYKFSPKQLKLILIDPKMLELSVYNDIAHLLTPVVTEPKKAIIALKWVCKEMERRYSMMNEEGTRSLEGYNQKASEALPYIVVFIDEMADLMMTAGKEVEHYVQRLAQMARACGIHLVMATQRPSVDIITGSIKANFPSRVSFQVASKYDSRTVLGEIGAEQLLGNGDMLMTKNGSNLIRYQSAFISDNEVNKLILEIKKSQKVQYLDELEEIIKNNDENFDELSEDDEALITRSIDLIRNTNKASTSFLQRNFQIGYNKAARIMEALEQRGVVSPPNHAGKREILLSN
ncbi:DNA translocase FtsK [Alphaproteobacteria bacterium]|nr:DNA translocase FtsK [Alphaproteobacteria bacterium]